MKRRTGYSVAAGVAVASVAAGLVAPSVASGSAGPRHWTFTAVVEDSKANVAPADFGSAPAPNQQATEDAPLAVHGTRVGTSESVITITRASKSRVLFIIECSVQLPGGKILWGGAGNLLNMGSGVTLPVAGGTGKYYGAAGSVTAVAKTKPDRTVLHFDFLTP